MNLTRLGIQLAGGKPAGYLQAWLRVWTRDYGKQIQLAVRVGLELGASELQVQRSHHSATLSPLNKLESNTSPLRYAFPLIMEQHLLHVC